MTLKIGIGLSFYQDFNSLHRMLDSIKRYPFDCLIAVDGRYKGYPGTRELSSADVRDLFASFQIPYMLIDAPNISQIEKRQIYFDESAKTPLDILIVMDSDEYIIHYRTKWDAFVKELEEHIDANKNTWIQGYTIPFQINQKRYTPDYIINGARVFHRPWELQYVDNHFTIRNKRTGINMGYQTDTTLLTQLMIGTDHKLRNEEYMKQHDAYEQWQQDNEESHDAMKKRLDNFIMARDLQFNARR